MNVLVQISSDGLREDVLAVARAAGYRTAEASDTHEALCCLEEVGARAVILLQRSAKRLELARERGLADVYVNTSEADPVEAVREATGGGVHFAFEMAGSVRALELAYRITRRGGETVTAGLPHPDHTFALQHVNLVAEERTPKGS